ncbi:hypothetical protein A4G19_15495 [Pasteurellaceae bacterium Macca]|nr:hypothetical protein [Pasteurellaceae bacterium Macca]
MINSMIEHQAVIAHLFRQELTAMTDSRKVAEVFGKQHKNILQAIENLDCSTEFRRLNFQQSYYLNEQNKRQPMVRMTQDGFTFLVMGFRGKKAAEFKEAYIKQFNKMRDWIDAREQIKHDQRRLNDAIKYRQDQTGKLNKYAYSQENNLIYRVALGQTGKQWLSENGYPDDDDIRQHLSENTLKLLDELTTENAVMIKLGMPYSERKIKLEQSALYVLRQQA